MRITAKYGIDTGMVLAENNRDREECCHACYRRLVFASGKFYCQLCCRQGEYGRFDGCFGFSLRRWEREGAAL